jgi:hypothetical protein
MSLHQALMHLIFVKFFELHHMEVIKIQNVNCKEKMSFCGLGDLPKLRKLDLPGILYHGSAILGD